LTFAAVAAMLYCALPAFRVAAAPAAKLATGQLLVASRKVSDARFKAAVVLLVRYDANSAMGLILNRPSDLLLSRTLEGVDAARDRHEPVYYGGPVGGTRALALLRARRAPATSSRVVNGVHLISTRSMLEKLLDARIPARDLRVYMGYAGWQGGRLDAEVRMGFWHVTPASAELVFDARPKTLWDRLIDRFEGLRTAIGSIAARPGAQLPPRA